MVPNSITTEMTKLKDKVRVLEVLSISWFSPPPSFPLYKFQKSQIKLKRKLTEQEAEIYQLRRITSSEISSSPEHLRGPFAARKMKLYSSPCPTEPELPVSFCLIIRVLLF